LSVAVPYINVLQAVEDTTKSEKARRVKLKKGSWEEGLLGVAKGCKRMIMLPPFLVVRSEFKRRKQRCCVAPPTANTPWSFDSRDGCEGQGEGERENSVDTSPYL
jgi:hypothetical protein